VTEKANVVALEVAPAGGDYVTNGKVLAQVIGLTSEAKFILEDCSKPCDAAPEDNVPLIVDPQELSSKWRRVEVPRAA
jgi:hypothetical protein